MSIKPLCKHSRPVAKSTEHKSPNEKGLGKCVSLKNETVQCSFIVDLWPQLPQPRFLWSTSQFILRGGGFQLLREYSLSVVSPSPCSGHSPSQDPAVEFANFHGDIFPPV